MVLSGFFPLCVSASAFALALGIGGCAATVEPARSLAKAHVTAESFRATSVQGRTFEAQWWRRFDDPTLARLIESALAANLDIRMAVLRVEEARAGLRATDARLAHCVLDTVLLLAPALIECAFESPRGAPQGAAAAYQSLSELIAAQHPDMARNCDAFVKLFVPLIKMHLPV